MNIAVPEVKETPLHPVVRLQVGRGVGVNTFISGSRCHLPCTHLAIIRCQDEGESWTIALWSSCT